MQFLIPLKKVWEITFESAIKIDYQQKMGDKSSQIFKDTEKNVTKWIHEKLGNKKGFQVNFLEIKSADGKAIVRYIIRFPNHPEKYCLAIQEYKDFASLITSKKLKVDEFGLISAVIVDNPL